MRSSLSRNRRAINRIGALAAAIIVTLAGGGLGLLHYSAQAVDKANALEERALVSNYMREREHELVGQVISASIWDDAYTRLAPQIDADWADLYVGSYFETYMRHAASFVLDGADRPVYAWRDGSRLPPQAASSFLQETAPLVSELRTLERSRGEARRRGLAGTITKTGVIRSDGAFYLVVVANVVPETPRVAPRPEADHLLVTARRIDAPFLAGLSRDMRVSDVRLTAGAPAPGAGLPILPADGRQAGALTWKPKAVAFAAMRRVGLLYGVGVATLFLAVLVLAARVRAALDEMSDNERALQRAMDELVQARDQAAAANVAKSQFLANMSHEIRTPLNGILGMTQIMTGDELGERQRQRLEVVRESGQTLLTVLNDILDISKIEAGRLEIDNHEFEIVAAVQAACGPFENLACQKDIDFRIEIDAAARGVWFGDGVRLRQVLANLASNAVKFTAQGQIVVSVGRVGSALSISVRDTGIGIPETRHADLFEKFSQVDATTTRRFGGAGLGLAISRELVDLMGGAMTVDSCEGQGSTFTVLLPLERRGAAVAPDMAPAGHATAAREGVVRILAAEDNPTNQLVLAAMLEPFDIELTLADNGAEAVDAFFAGAFDLILMDVQMPVMNGVEATAAIRRLEAERDLPATPILALSANVMSHQVAEYLAAGMNGFIPKPIDTTRLLTAIDEVLLPAEPQQRRA